MSSPTKLGSKRVITPEATLSYPHLFEPVAGPDGGEPKYAATLVFAPETDLSALKAAAMAAAVEKLGSKEKVETAIRTGKLAWPFREADEESGYPKGSIFFGARSKAAPGLVSRYAGPDGKPKPITLEDQKPGNPLDLYPGCKVRASLVAFYYDYMGMKKGVSFALNNIQKLGEGTRLDNRRAASDEFEADLNEEPASVDDLL
jgi:hypothetical protein